MRLNNDKLLKALGLASKAGKLIYGEKLFEQIKKNKIKIIFTTNDIGQAQFKKINNIASFYNIKIVNNLFDSEMLNKAIGKNNIKCLAINDENFAKLILKNID